MKPLFDHIKARIEAQVPAIKTIRMWNNQFLNSNDPKQRKEKAFKYPACFIEFDIQKITNRILRIQDIELIVRFRFGVESYKFARLDTFTFCDSFAAKMQSMSPPAGASTINFTTFQENFINFDEDFDNVEVPVKEYKTIYRHLASYTPLTTHGPFTPDPSGYVVSNVNDPIIIDPPL